MESCSGLKKKNMVSRQDTRDDLGQFKVGRAGFLDQAIYIFSLNIRGGRTLICHAKEALWIKFHQLEAPMLLS